MRDLKNFLIPPTLTIRQAIAHLERVIDDFRTLFVLDPGKRLIGTLEDGDIRRALVGEDLNFCDPVTKIIHRNPVVLKKNQRLSLADIRQLARFKYVPVIDEGGILLEFVEISDATIRLPNKAVIMAGGLGSRLGKLTEETPKPMLTVGAKPILELIVDQFRAHNIKDLYISVNYRPEKIQEYFGDGSRFGVQLTYLEEKERLGTAGCLSLIQEKVEDPFFVMNGDLLTDAHLGRLLAFHQDHGFAATMCAVRHSVHIPFGVIHAEGDRVQCITEKPQQTYLINAGLYVLGPDCLERVPKGKYLDMPTFFQGMVGEGQPTGVFVLDGFWLDIGHPEDLKKADIAYKTYFRGAPK